MGAVLASVPLPSSAATLGQPARGPSSSSPSSSSSSSVPPERTAQFGPSAPRGATWYPHRPIGEPYVTTVGAGGPGATPPMPNEDGDGRGTRSSRSARPAVDVPTSAPSRSLSQRGRCLSSSSSSILRSLSVRGLLPVPPLPTQNLNWKWKRAWAVRRRLLGSTHGRHHLPRVTHPYVRYCIVVLTTRSETQKKIFNLQI